ncbi:Hypothetical protein LUCI_0780 [Lucifera butyrica]|uniref:Uncharacterized protein n=1 Tax=Lucifera butyrica TaxID=1351585 RepID=A0A498R438_9FIRM|nr:hypothetical protein [Lucifera butyrica]VBB05570.1 Hypothetical protein LUCI_0780 [Lucifera butyrica]
MGTPSAKNLLLGAGQVFFDRFDAGGNRTGLRHFGNVPKFNLKTEVDKVEKKSSMNAARTTYAEAIREIKSSADLTLEEFDPANLALALLGEEGVIIQEAGSVADQKQKAYKGRMIQVDAYNISDIVVKPINPTPAVIAAVAPVGNVTSDGTVTSSGTYTGATAEGYYIVITAAPTNAGTITGCKYQWKKGLSGVLSSDVTASGNAQSLEKGISVKLSLSGSQSFVVGDTWKISVTPAMTEYTAGTDFKTNSVLCRGGLISIPETSRIPDATDVLVSYTKAAGAFPKVAAATVGSVEGFMLFLGDPTKGPAYNGEFWHVSVTPNGDVALIGEDFAGFDITVTVLDDRENHPNEPLHRLIKLN